MLEEIKAVSTLSAKLVVATLGGTIGGAAGLVAGTVVGATMGTIDGVKAGAQMALGMIWPDHEEGNYEAEELVETMADDIKAEIKAIEQEMRDLAGPAGKPKRGRGRPKKAIAIDHDELDDQELREYQAGKNHLAPDPIF